MDRGRRRAVDLVRRALDAILAACLYAAAIGLVAWCLIGLALWRHR